MSEIKLSPEYMQGISGLQLISKKVLQGHFSGNHKSIKIGAGIDFKQYKSYQPGDDLRYMDWKYYARSGKHYIKESEIDTEITLRIIIDASGSMMVGEKHQTKLDMARFLTFAICSIAIEAGDSVQVISVSEKEIVRSKMLRNRSDLPQIARFLLDIKGKGVWKSQTENLLFEFNKDRKRMTLLISDFLDPQDYIFPFVSTLNAISGEFLALEVTEPMEENFDFKGLIEFVDIETGQKREMLASQIKKKYKRRISELRLKNKEFFRSRGIDHDKVSTDDDISLFLNRFINQRQRVIR